MSQLPAAKAAQRKLEMDERGVSSFEARGCRDKRSYLSRYAAKRSARVQRGKGRIGLVAYKCPHCSLFHLCKAENSNRKRSGE